jgi:ankyrin repeat protein
MSRDDAGWTPLHAAARSGFTEAAHELFAHVYTLGPTNSAAALELANCSGAGGDTPLHRAAYWGHTPRWPNPNPNPHPNPHPDLDTPTLTTDPDPNPDRNQARLDGRAAD